jgi:hypothetical protein
MKKTIVILFASIILFNFLSRAQEVKYGINDTLYFEPTEGLKEYYLYVDTAEMKIVEDNYELAALYYLEAFKHKAFPFIDDLNRAWHIAHETKDTNLLKMVYEIDYQTTNLNPTEYINSIIRYYETIDTNFLHNLIPNLESISKIKANNNICCILDSLVKVDQKVRGFENGVKVTDSINYDNLALVDSLNFYALMNLYDKYSHISFMNTQGDEKCSCSYISDISSLLIHNTSRINIWYPIMLEQVYKGYFPGKELVNILSRYRYKDSVYFATRQGKALLDKYVIVKLSKEEEIKANNLRKRFFMESYLDTEMKKLWIFKQNFANPIFFFSPLKFEFPPIKMLSEEKIKEYRVQQDEFISILKEKHGSENIIIFEK